MAFSILGLIDGITGTAVVILGIVFGIYFYHQGKQRNAKLMKQLAFFTIFAGLLYLGVLVDFLSLIMTNNNFPNDRRQVALLTYIWFGPVIILALYIAVQVQFPEKTKQIVIPFIILSVIYYFLIFIDPLGSFYSGYYENNKPRLIDYNINITSPAGIIFALMLFPTIIIFGVGMLYQSSKTSGDLKKKFLLLAVGAFCYGISGLFEGFTQPGVGVIFVRIGFLSSFWIMYFGLKPVKEI